MVTIENNELATRNIHSHSFTCNKNKKKLVRIQPHEGHGKFKPPNGSSLLTLPKCRFQFPRFPMLISKILEPLSTEEFSEEEIKNGDSNNEHDDEKERSFNSDERSNQKGQETTRNSRPNIQFPGPPYYRLVPRYPLPVPLQYYRPVQYQLVPRPYAYINRGQHFYSAFI